jgi:hypothetical protein
MGARRRSRRPADFDLMSQIEIGWAIAKNGMAQAAA